MEDSVRKKKVYVDSTSWNIEYCEYCGSEMYQFRYISHYSNQTGKPYFETEYRCPKKLWYEFWHDYDFYRTYIMK